MPGEAISRSRGQRRGKVVPDEEVAPRGLTEVPNDGGVEALVSSALPQGVGGLHQQVFEGERRVVGRNPVRVREPCGGGVEAGLEQQRLSHRFVRSTRLRELGADSRLSDVMRGRAEPHELAIDLHLRLAKRTKQPNGDVVHEREVGDEPWWRALLLEQLEHTGWK